MIKKSKDGKQRILSLSYGKDSLACLGAIEQLNWELDKIVTVDTWATDAIPAELPPMIEFKKKADEIIKERYGIEVEHICSTDKDKNKITYEKIFYSKRKFGKRSGEIIGFPYTLGAWCNSELKIKAIKSISNYYKDSIQYIGIASDEEKRFHNLNEHKKSPLYELGWTEADAMQWCKDNDLVSPIYENTSRGGCWFCHNQKIKELKNLKENYPEYYKILLKWDNDSPCSFKADGHTVHDYDKRLKAEDLGLVPKDRKFRWKMLDELDIE